MYPQAMKITMTRLEHGQQGLTFFKDEPGQAPIVELHNVPAAWTSYGTLNIKISLILNEDKDTACGYKTVRGEKGDARGLKLRDTGDRRYAKQNKIDGDYEAWLPVQRQASSDGRYTIPICKSMMLSRGERYSPRHGYSSETSSLYSNYNDHLVPEICSHEQTTAGSISGTP